MELAEGVIAAQQWEAPSVAVTEGSRKTRGGDRSNELLLTGQAEAVSERWSSPKASDPEKAGPNMRGSITRQDGKSRADILSYQAEQFFHPPSSPDQPTTLAGAICSTDTPNTNQPSVKRKLNPIFVEALMRWPTGLSGFERPAMAWIQWLQRQLGFLSTLHSQPEAAQQEMF